jgi:WD40 repeat protein
LEELVTAGHDGTISVWNIATGMQVGDPLETNVKRGLWGSKVSIVSEKYTACTTAAGIVILWDRGSRNCVLRVENNKSVALCATVCDGNLVVGLWFEQDCDMQIIDARTGHRVGDTLKGHTSRVIAFAVVDGKIAAASADGTVLMWNIDSGKQIGEAIKIDGEAKVMLGFDHLLIIGKADGINVNAVQSNSGNLPYPFPSIFK